MKKLILLLAICSCWQIARSQGISFKVRSKVYIRNANPDYPIKYSAGKELTEDTTAKTYDKNGQLISITRTLKKDWIKETVFNPDLYSNLAGRKFLYADLLQSDDKKKVNIYFWPFEEETSQKDNTPTSKQSLTAAEKSFNDAIKNGSFFIELAEREYVTFRTSALHSGPLTIPFKVYLGSLDDRFVSNVATEVNAGAYIGQKWGKKGFVNLPQKRKAKVIKPLLPLI